VNWADFKMHSATIKMKIDRMFGGHVYVYIIIIIIIRHQLDLDRPVSAYSDSLFEGLPVHLACNSALFLADSSSI